MKRDVLGLLDFLYEAMLDDGLWEGALTKLRHHLDVPHLALFSTSPATKQTFRYDLQGGITPAMMEAYSGEWIHHDSCHTIGLRRPAYIPQTHDTLGGMRQLRRTAYFNEFAKPNGIEVLMACWLERRENRGVVISFPRSERDGLYTKDDQDRLAQLVPHLRRIIYVKDKIQALGEPVANLLSIMDRLPFGVMLLAQDLRIVEASHVARELLSKKAEIREDGGVLTLSDARLMHRLRSLFMNEPKTPACSDVVEVSRKAARPLVLFQVPIVSSQETWFAPRTRWLLFVFDPDRQFDVPKGEIQQLLSLTKAEAALVQTLVRGRSVKEAAAELGIAVETARAQLKSVYRKTGLNSQSQLMRSVLTSPPLLGSLGSKKN